MVLMFNILKYSTTIPTSIYSSHAYLTKKKKRKKRHNFYTSFVFETTAAAGRDLITEHALSLVEQGKMLTVAGSLPWQE